MAALTSGVNAAERIDPVIKSALAHFFFVTIHPFELRAIADMLRARSEKTLQRFYSMLSDKDDAEDAVPTTG